MRTIAAMVIVFLITTSSLAGVCQTPMGGRTDSRSELHTPDRGSSERKAIMDALRIPIEKKLRQSVVFRVDHLKVKDGWAFLLGKPQRPDGTPVEYSSTPYKDAVDAGAFDDGIVALLQESKGKWRVVQYVIGATDVPYVDWDKKYRAPRAIFPQT